jgi:hypothetical protein
MPMSFGIEPNRKALEAMAQLAVDQKMVPRNFRSKSCSRR